MKRKCQLQLEKPDESYLDTYLEEIDWHQQTKPWNIILKTGNEKGFKGRRKISLTTFSQDLDNIYLITQTNRDHNYYCRLKLNNREDLESLKSQEDDRKDWRRLVRRIVEASEATHPVEEKAGSHWLAVVGCWLPVVGCWLPVVRSWLVVVGCWWAVVRSWLAVVGWWLVVEGC